MRIGMAMLVSCLLFVFDVAQAAPPEIQAPAGAKSQQATPQQPRLDHQRFKQAQKPQALGREGRVSMEPDDEHEEEEPMQSRPKPMSGQAGRQSAPMRAPAGAAQQTQGR